MQSKRRAGYRQANEQDGLDPQDALAQTLVMDEQEQEHLIAKLHEESIAKSSATSRNVDILVCISMLLSFIQLTRLLVRSGPLSTALVYLLFLPLHLPFLSADIWHPLRAPTLNALRTHPRFPLVRNVALAGMACLCLPAGFALLRGGRSNQAGDAASALGRIAPLLVAGVRVLVDREEQSVARRVEELQGLRYRLKGA